MQTDALNRSLKAVTLQRNVLLVLFALSILTIGALAQGLARIERTVILSPSSLPGDVVAIGEVDPRYLEALSRDALASLLNVTPHTTDAPRKVLSAMASAAGQGEILARWDRIAEEIRRREISRAFFLSRLSTDIAGLTVIADGRLHTYLGATLQEESEVQYRLTFEQTGGAIRLASLSEITQTPDKEGSEG